MSPDLPWLKMTAEWTIVVAGATILLALATVGLASTAYYQLKKLREQELLQFYTQIDNVYYDIQKLIIKNPHLALPTGHKTADEVHQYNAFAFMTWNVIEAIVDYCEKYKELHDTWDVIVRYEAKQHIQWFREPSNRVKFKKKFQGYVDRLFVEP